MLWLTWRQYKAALLIGILLLVLYGLNFLGEIYQVINFPTTWEGLIPLLIAVFVGAPFISREREQKTHYIVWGQGTSRSRWFVSRLVWVSIGVVIVAALFAWSSNIINDWNEARTNSTSIWGHPGIALIPLSLFGLMLGVIVGCFTRKSIVAMAITFVLIATCSIVYHNEADYLIPPHVQYIEYRGDKALWGKPEELALYAGFADRQGHETGSVEDYCSINDPNYKGNVNQCVKDLDLQWKLVYQTPDRFWPLQFAGAALLLVVSLVLAIVAYLRVRSAVD